jgi:hypothetical protein
MRYYKCHDQNFVINHCVNVSTIVIANTHFSNRSHRVNFQPTINFNLLLLWCKARCWSFHHTSIDNCYIIYVITSFLVVIITNYTLPVFHHQSLGHTFFFSSLSELHVTHHEILVAFIASLSYHHHQFISWYILWQVMKNSSCVIRHDYGSSAYSLILASIWSGLMLWYNFSCCFFIFH